MMEQRFVLFRLARTVQIRGYTHHTEGLNVKGILLCIFLTVNTNPLLYLSTKKAETQSRGFEPHIRLTFSFGFTIVMMLKSHFGSVFYSISNTVIFRV